ncbi:MAG: hypothetical protein K2X54_27600, partial [Methylobacterium organophilum]|nr:hypothetical protein [Methylobacterium organophilum]
MAKPRKKSRTPIAQAIYEARLERGRERNRRWREARADRLATLEAEADVAAVDDRPPRGGPRSKLVQGWSLDHGELGR